MIDRRPIFADRREAERRLAEALRAHKADEPIVLALPRGGVPVAYEVAAELEAPMDLLVVDLLTRAEGKVRKRMSRESRGPGDARPADRRP